MCFFPNLQSGLMIAPVIANLGPLEALSFQPNPSEVQYSLHPITIYSVLRNHGSVFVLSHSAFLPLTGGRGVFPDA